MRRLRAFLPLLLALLMMVPGSAAALDTKPLLYSLLLPGLGEWSLGYKGRAVAHFAVEAGCWTGNYLYRQKGFELRDDYEAYADKHWHPATWASAFSEGQPEWMDWLDAAEWEEYAWDELQPTAVDFDTLHTSPNGDQYLVSHYAPHHEDPQHYYENLGKYDWYRWGWDDYSSDTDRSDHRYVYLDMRNDSNAAFDTAHNLISLMVVARVVSLVDTFILIRKLDGGASRAEIDNAWRLEFQPRDPREAAFRLALTRRF